MRRKLNLLGLIGLCILIGFNSVSHFSKPGFLPLHFLAYFGLASAFLVNFHDTRIGHFEEAAAAFIFGFLMEVVQLSVPYRYFSIRDIGMNFAGAALVFFEAKIPVVHKVVEWEDRLIEAVLRKTGL